MFLLQGEQSDDELNNDPAFEAFDEEKAALAQVSFEYLEFNCFDVFRHEKKLATLWSRRLTATLS